MDQPVVGFPQLLEDSLNQLSSAELQIARALMDSNYLAGMENASRLAEKAGVSNPTVARFAERLGYKNYAEMRRTIINHHEARLKGPDDLAREQTNENDEGVGMLYQSIVNDSFKKNNIDALRNVARLIAGSSVPVISTGGVFSTVAARLFHMHLRILRKNSIFLDASMDRQSELLDLKSGSIGVIFDFRRYQPDTLEFAQGFKKRGGRIVLITDPFLSPVAELAEQIMTVKSDGVVPFDSTVGAIILAELLLQQVYQELGPAVRKRLKQFDGLRTDI